MTQVFIMLHERKGLTSISTKTSKWKGRNFNQCWWLTNDGGGPLQLILNCQNFHHIGSLLPKKGSSPKFVQLYIHDMINEMLNRMQFRRIKWVLMRRYDLKVFHRGENDLTFVGKHIVLPTSFTKLPDSNLYPRLAKVVSNFMIHGPCGTAKLKFPYMKSDKCCNYVLKSFQPSTIVGEEGYPRWPLVQRLSFHLLNQKSITILEEKGIDSMIRRNKELDTINFPKGKELTYAKFPIKFVYLKGAQVITILRQLIELRIKLFKRLLDNDRKFFDVIIEASELAFRNQLRRLFITLLVMNSASKAYIFWWFSFFYGYGGTSKTFIWKTLSIALRLKGLIVINIASSGIVFTISRRQGSLRAKILLHSKLIIWDETPMLNRFCFEAIDCTLRYIMRYKCKDNLYRSFGGKMIVLGGDFKKILLVLKKSCNNNQFFQNMVKLQNFKIVKKHEIRCQYIILNIGEGKLESNEIEESNIEISNELLIDDFENPLLYLVNFTYPQIDEKEYLSFDSIVQFGEDYYIKGE
ncbi:hypothetical protein CR513_42815, partial [Mucuna pruriens]